MAIRTESVRLTIPRSLSQATSRLAALPPGAVVAVFDSRTEAVGAAVHLAVETPERSVWLATGEQAGLAIRTARAARSLLQRLLGGLSDDEALVQQIIRDAERDKTVLVAATGDAGSTLTRLGGARQVVEFGRWTTRTIR